MKSGSLLASGTSDEIKNDVKVREHYLGDDFGSGYSNFEHLLKMNIDYLKIDASLIKNIATNENSYKITKTIIEFAKNLNLKTIAEFVENEEIFNIVRNLGADYSQGYFFSAPISAPNIKEYNENGDKNHE
jgi:EAL domain-containing protein (putative c-di-GMP-specific phosphodiesterase class I)